MVRMVASHSGSVVSRLTVVGLAVSGLLLVSCGSDQETSTSPPPATPIPVDALTPPSGVITSNSTVAPDATTSVTAHTIVVPITIAPVTVATGPVGTGTTVATSSIPAPTPATCPGNTTLPAGVVTGDQIVGDADGDGIDDTVTEYTSTDGQPHVFLQRGGANASDVALPLGNAGTVSISWEDVDYSLGAEVAPPKVILAIGVGPAGSAPATFLSPDPSSGNGHCLAQWRRNGEPFTFTIDQRGPFSGLLCDGAAGRRYYVLRTATPDGLGAVSVSAQEIDHDGIEVTLKELGDESIPDDPAVQYNFGDVQNCDHPPLFADLPAIPIATTTTIAATTTSISG
jgi:hypothetical protein